MTISESTEVFGGKPVRDYDPDAGLVDAASAAWRIAIDWDRYENDEKATDLLSSLLDDPNAGQVTALVFGDWGGTAEGNNSGPVVEMLVDNASKLPRLTALFLGDMTFEECEVSWINQCDISPIYAAFPNLEELRIRGTMELSLGQLEHDRLRRLIIETGGLTVAQLRQVASAELPMLEHLEVWLGDDGYGWDGSADDVKPLLDGARFPKLKYLGLRNSQDADEIAEAAASAPVVTRIEVLDLSLGTMSDAGAAALASSTAVRSLKKLDVHHNYLTDAGVAKLSKLGIEVEAGDQQDTDEDGDRYVAVSE